MKQIGLTGGIGSGKTTVANLFSNLGIPIYIADIEAKKLMNTSKVLQRHLIQLFGAKAYVNNQLNRPYIASVIFKNEEYLEKMNAIVHPKVAKHYAKWVRKQNAPYVLKETAILFENGSYKNYDAIITVVAPLNLRVERLLQRNTTTISKIEAIVENQWSDEERVKLSDYIIENIELETTKKQVLKIHNQILETINQAY